MRLAPALLALLVAPALSGCAAPGSAKAADILATFYPLAFLAGRIAGPNATVETLVPEGVEPHEYEPTTTDFIRVSGAKLLVLQGAGFEAWAAQARAQAPETRVATATEGLAMRSLDQDGSDPHTWLSPPLFANMSRNVERGLVDAFPQHAAAFRERAQGLRTDLATLDADFASGLADCATRIIITNHASFGYLADEYHFEQRGISGLSPDAEPDPRTVQELAALAKEHDIRIVFFEELASPRVAEVVAEEAGAETRVLSPLESAPKEGDYLSAMRRSLLDLREAMRCT